jgi:adenylate cyclase class IV
MRLTKNGNLVSLYKENDIYYQIKCSSLSSENISFSSRKWGTAIFNKTTREMIYSSKSLSEPYRKHLRLAMKVREDYYKGE